MYWGASPMPRKRDLLLPQARDLYSQGHTYEEISTLLDVSKTTLSKWAKGDAAAGRSWEKRKREHLRKSPLVLLEILEGRFEALVERMQGADEAEQPGLIDALQKLQKVIDSRRAQVGDYSTILGVMEQFAGWCPEGCTESELSIVRAVLERFLSGCRKGAI